MASIYLFTEETFHNVNGTDTLSASSIKQTAFSSKAKAFSHMTAEVEKRSDDGKPPYLYGKCEDREYYAQQTYDGQGDRHVMYVTKLKVNKI